MTSWRAHIQVRSGIQKLLVLGSQGEDLLKARLPLWPEHPRAVLTLLEGMALYSGAPLSAVIDVDGPVDHSLGVGGFGEDWPTPSAMVSFELVRSRPRRGRITGMGDFHQLNFLDRTRGCP